MPGEAKGAERRFRTARGPAPTGTSDLLDLAADERIRRQIEQLLGASRREPDPERREETLRIAVLAGFPDRVAKRREKGKSEVLLASGGSATLAAESSVRDAPLLVAIDVEERRGRGRLVRLASAIEPEWLLDLFPDELRETVDVVWDEERGRATILSRLEYGALVLEERRRPPNESERGRAEALLAERVRPEQLIDAETLRSLRARAELLAEHVPEAGIRKITEADLDEAMRDLYRGHTSLDELRGADLEGTEFVQLPGGRKLRVEYVPGQAPAARSRLQDFFGMRSGPRVAGGKVPIVLHLLAPNGRAQQVTSDLEGFWQRHYPAVRRELMRRYPRHAWPEDGATASPPPSRR